MQTIKIQLLNEKEISQNIEITVNDNLEGVFETLKQTLLSRLSKPTIQENTKKETECPNKLDMFVENGKIKIGKPDHNGTTNRCSKCLKKEKTKYENQLPILDSVLDEVTFNHLLDEFFKK